MEFSSIFWTTVLWVIVWGAIGGMITPRIYLGKDLDISNTPLVGAAIGAATGPIGLVPLWYFTPQLTPRCSILPGILLIVILSIAFGRADPNNLCVSSGDFVASQLTNGIVIGIIYGLMALGLTLIFSILGVVSFAHGEFYMIGGMLVFPFCAINGGR